MANRFPTRRIHFGALALLALMVAVLPIDLRAEEEVKSPHPYALESYASIRETVTDNGGLSAANKRTESITQPIVGVRASANSAQLKGFLDYSLSGLVYSGDSSRDRFQNALSAFGTAALVENRAYVDVLGSISQQSVSAFGIQAPDSASVDRNRVEVSTFSVSPYLRGRLGGVADYEARLSYAGTHGNVSAVSDSSTSLAQLRLGGATSLAILSWSAQLSHTEVDYSLGRRTEADFGQGVLTWTVSPQFTFSVIGGAESNNYLSPDKESHTLAGLGITLRPSERTALSAQTLHRFFGESHSLNFKHRAARTVWAFSDSRDISSNPGQPVVGNLGNAFDLVFEQFAPIEPDPIARRQLVNGFLQARGIDPATQLFAAFPTSAVIVQRLRSFSVAWLAPRDTVTFFASESDSRRLDTVTAPSGDFLSTTVIRQRGLALNLSHLLTPLSSISVNAAYQRTSGSLDSLTTSLKSLTAQWSRQIGRRIDGSLGARHAIFGSATSPYDETAVYGTLRMQF